MRAAGTYLIPQTFMRRLPISLPAVIWVTTFGAHVPLCLGGLTGALDPAGDRFRRDSLIARLR